MLTRYQRQIISQFFNDDGYVLDLSYNTYHEWLHNYVKDSYIINNVEGRFEIPGWSKGRATEYFIMKGKSTEVLKFSKDLLIHYKHIGSDIHSKGYKQVKNIILNEDIKSKSITTKNLIFINGKHPDDTVNNLIDSMYKKFSESLQLKNLKDRGELNRKLILDAGLLLGDIYDNILYDHNEYDIYGKSSFNKKQKRSFYLIHLDKNNIETKSIQDIKKYEKAQINKSNSDITKGLNNIVKDFMLISKSLKVMRNDISYAHDKGPVDLYPTNEETIFCLNAASTLARFLVYKEINQKDKGE